MTSLQRRLSTRQPLHDLLSLITLVGVVVLCILAKPTFITQAQNCNPGRFEIAVYLHDDFKGTCVNLGVGNYRNPSAARILNDDTSSLKVGSDVQVLLCEHDDYGGECEVFTQSAIRLTGSVIGNDRVSSIRVLQLGKVECEPGPDQIALFKHRNFITPCEIKVIGEHGNVATAAVPNDSVSSVMVGANVRAVLCSDADFQGGCRVFHNSAARLTGEPLRDNTLSSVSVFLPPRYTFPETIFADPNYEPKPGRGDYGQSDNDRDGLRDLAEDKLAEAFKPFLKFDAQEGKRRKNPAEPIVIFQVRPISCPSCVINGNHLAIRWVFLFLRDGGYPDGSGCGVGERDAHDGDNDRATFILSSADTGITWELEQVHIAGPADPQQISGKIVWPLAHVSPAGTHAGWLEISSRRHPYIYMSNGKHHMYLHKGDWSDSPYSSVDLWDDCGDDVDGEDTVNPDLRSVRGSLLNNVGEPAIASAVLPRFVNDLRHLFPKPPCRQGRGVWSLDKFCSDATEANYNNWLNTPIPRNPRSIGQ